MAARYFASIRRGSRMPRRALASPASDTRRPVGQHLGRVLGIAAAMGPNRGKIALVDVAMVEDRFVGAIWKSTGFRDIFMTFGLPQAIGMSATARLCDPVDRLTPEGRHIRPCPDAPRQLLAPIASGLIDRVGIRLVAYAFRTIDVPTCMAHAAKATGFGMAGITVDGLGFLAVFAAAGKVIRRAREGARAFGRDRIHVSAICPGVVATDMWKLIDKGFRDEARPTATMRHSRASRPISCRAGRRRPVICGRLGLSCLVAVGLHARANLLVNGGMVLI